MQNNMDRPGNACDRLEIGSYYFLSVNAWPVAITPEGDYRSPPGRHGDVAIFGFQDIPGGLDLYLTDRAWSEHTQSFVPNTMVGDGIVTIKSPSGRGFPAGLAFGMGNNSVVRDNYGLNWTDVDVNSTVVNTSQYFKLEDDGDQIFLYCKGSDGKDRPLAGFSYNGPFLQNTTSDIDYGTNTSSAPAYFYERPSLEVLNSTDPTPGLLVMRTPGDYYGSQIFWNWEFLCPVASSGCKMDFIELRNAMSDATYNWIGSNPDGTFSYPPSASSQSSLHWMSNAFALLLLMWLLVMV